MEYDRAVKLMLIGDSGVGKTCINSRFCNDEYTDSYQSTNFYESKTRIINVENVRIKVMIYEIPHINPSREYMPKYFRGIHGFLLVYDVTDSSSFNDIDKWIAPLKLYANDDIICTLLGTKCDLSSKKHVTYDAGKLKADNFEYSFFETSAKTGEHIDDAFTDIVTRTYKKQTNIIPVIQISEPMSRSTCY